MTQEQQLCDELEAIVIPWLGECDIFGWRLFHKIRGHGFTSVSLFTSANETRPHWIEPRWREATTGQCPRCGGEIEMLLKSHRTGPANLTGKPFIFCRCVRLHPSRMPDPAFFTDNWGRVLKIVDLADRIDQQDRSRMLGKPGSRRGVPHNFWKTGGKNQWPVVES